jgi:hypothetical protein
LFVASRPFGHSVAPLLNIRSRGILFFMDINIRAHIAPGYQAITTFLLSAACVIIFTCFSNNQGSWHGKS